MRGIWLTLVVASRFGTGTRLFCDTRVTYPHGENPHFLRGTLKAILLHPALCIAYAGDVASAVSAIRDLNVSRSSGFSLEKVVSSLERTHNRVSADTQFIVASAADGETLTVIKEGRATRADHCWIDNAGSNRLGDVQPEEKKRNEVEESCPEYGRLRGQDAS